MNLEFIVLLGNVFKSLDKYNTRSQAITVLLVCSLESSADVGNFLPHRLVPPLSSPWGVLGVEIVGVGEPQQSNASHQDIPPPCSKFKVGEEFWALLGKNLGT